MIKLINLVFSTRAGTWYDLLKHIQSNWKRKYILSSKISYFFIILIYSNSRDCPKEITRDMIQNGYIKLFITSTLTTRSKTTYTWTMLRLLKDNIMCHLNSCAQETLSVMLKSHFIICDTADKKQDNNSFLWVLPYALCGAKTCERCERLEKLDKNIKISYNCDCNDRWSLPFYDFLF